jgi:hypothetical protein
VCFIQQQLKSSRILESSQAFKQVTKKFVSLCPNLSCQALNLTGIHCSIPPCRYRFRFRNFLLIAHDYYCFNGYLGEPTFQWLCACAIYPELLWELTVYLGSLTALGKNLVTEHNILKLIQLSWFRAGFIPDAERLTLIESLDTAKEQAVREAIVDLLMHSLIPSRDSYAYDDWRLTFVSQSALRHRGQPKRLKSELRELSRRIMC